MDKEIQDEMAELHAIHKADYLHKKRIYEKSLEDWYKQHEIYEALRHQRRKEFEERMANPSLGFNEQDLRLKANAITEESEEANVDQPKTQTLEVTATWTDDVFEEPMPEAPEEKPFQESKYLQAVQEVNH